MELGVRTTGSGEKIVYYYKRYPTNSENAMAKKATSLRYFRRFGLDVDIKNDPIEENVVMQGLRLYNQGTSAAH